MKASIKKRVIVELEPAEANAFEIVLDVLDQMVTMYEEEDTEEIYYRVPQVGEGCIVDGEPQRAITAIENVLSICN